MSGVAGKGVHLGLDGFALAVEIDIAARPLAVALDGPPGGAGGLVADEEDIIFWVVNSFFQMIDDSAAGAHAAAGQDDGRAIGIAELQVIAVVLYGVKAVEVDGVITPLLCSSLASLSQYADRLE